MTYCARLIPAAILLVAAIPAFAQTNEAKSPAVAEAAPARTAATSSSDTDKTLAPFATPVIEADALAAITGKADLAAVISAKNTSNVSNNSVSGNSVTGSIAFDSASFSGLNGLSLLSANTGNNVSINSSLNVNVVIRP